VKARRTSTVVVQLGRVVMGDYRRSYPDTPPPPLASLDPRETSPNRPPDDAHREAEQWTVTAWVIRKMEQMKTWVSGH